MKIHERIFGETGRGGNSVIFASHVSENRFERGAFANMAELYDNFYPGRRAKVTRSKIKLRSEREESHFSSNQRGLFILIRG